MKRFSNGVIEWVKLLGWLAFGLAALASAALLSISLVLGAFVLNIQSIIMMLLVGLAILKLVKINDEGCVRLSKHDFEALSNHLRHYIDTIKPEARDDDYCSLVSLAKKLNEKIVELPYYEIEFLLRHFRRYLAGSDVPKHNNETSSRSTSPCLQHLKSILVKLEKLERAPFDVGACQSKMQVKSSFSEYIKRDQSKILIGILIFISVILFFSYLRDKNQREIAQEYSDYANSFCNGVRSNECWEAFVFSKDMEDIGRDY